MAAKFKFEEKCPFFHIKKFICLSDFNYAATGPNIQKEIYDIIADDVNTYCIEHDVTNMILPGQNIDIKTSLSSNYNNIPVVINLKRTDFDQWQAWIYSTPLLQFAIYFDPSFNNLRSLTRNSLSKQNFEIFFNQNCTQDILTTLQDAREDNILLPAGCYDASGRYPLFVRFSRNQRASYPPYRLDMFMKSPADKDSRLCKDVFIIGDTVEKARIKVSRQDITKDIENILDSIDDASWHQKLKNARELGRDIAGELTFCKHIFTLQLLRNRDHVLSIFGDWSVPDVVLQLYEKTYVRPKSSGYDDETRLDHDDALLQGDTTWLNQMEWHADLSGDLALLAGVKKEDIDIRGLLKNKNIEELCIQSQEKPAWFDSGLTAFIPQKNDSVKIWGRMDYNPNSIRPYNIRLFSIWEPAHPLNQFATCFVSPFVDLTDMLNTQEQRYNLLDVMQEFADRFREALQKNSPLEQVGFFKENEIYCAKTHFGRPKNRICAYFSGSNYYKGTVSQNYFLNFFYYEKPYTRMNNSQMQEAVESMLIGNRIQNIKQPHPNILGSIKEFKKIKGDITPKEGDIFQLFLLAQKRAIVAQEQFRLERAEKSKQRDALLRRLFHQIGHYTSAIGGNISFLQESQENVKNTYLDNIKFIIQDINNSVNIFKVLTSNSDDLRERFNKSLIYESDGEIEKRKNIYKLDDLFYNSIYEGLGRLLHERKFENEIKSYLAQYCTHERWDSLDISEKDKYLDMMKESLRKRYPTSCEQINKLSIATLDEKELLEELLSIWSYESAKKAYLDIDKHNNKSISAFIKKYFFPSFQISGTEKTYFDSKDSLSYDCIKSILDELCFNALKYATPGEFLEFRCLHAERAFILLLQNNTNSAQQFKGSSTGLQACEGIVTMLGGKMKYGVEEENSSGKSRFKVTIEIKN